MGEGRHKRMKELNLSSYIQTLRTGLMTHDGQEAAGVFLLSAINDQDYVGEHGYRTDNLSAKKISNLVNRRDPVPDGIQQASVIPEVVEDTITYFENVVIADMNPHLKDDTLGKLAEIIQGDPSIPERKKKKLIALYDAEDDGKFLAMAFLYAVNRPNKKINAEVQYEDAPLLAEANYECPLCHKKLVDMIKGRAIKKYKIVKIYPENLDVDTAKAFQMEAEKPTKLDVPENLIALDEECAKNYLLEPTVEEYKQLYAVKKIISRNYAAKSTINSIRLEEDIRIVLRALGEITDPTVLVPLSYDALRIDEKFEPENYILKTETQVQVLKYYRYIESVFSESDADFDLIASEIKVTSQHLEKSGMSQEEVIYHLSEWIRNKAKLGNNGRLACTIVVSFFIQNCEVFYR